MVGSEFSRRVAVGIGQAVALLALRPAPLLELRARDRLRQGFGGGNEGATHGARFVIGAVDAAAPAAPMLADACYLSRSRPSLFQ